MCEPQLCAEAPKEYLAKKEPTRFVGIASNRPGALEMLGAKVFGLVAKYELA